MLKLREIKVLHLESTDVCQAACPLCSRETDPLFDKHKQHHLGIDQILKHFDNNAIAQLDKMFMCGDYGDPAAGKHTLEIYRYFRDINPEIILGMNTNGAIQNTAWWQCLGELFHKQQDYVVFSIDGLKDTNHIYRRGVNWNKLMENIQAYIATGASAHWDMLIYKHNEHQIDACEALAREMGFTWFRAKVSKRPYINGLELPTQWNEDPRNNGPIQCMVLDEQSAYIDAHGRQSPCCWLGSRLKDFITDIDQVQNTWNTDTPNPVCKKICSTNINTAITNFKHQWRKEIQL